MFFVLMVFFTFVLGYAAEDVPFRPQCGYVTPVMKFMPCNIGDVDRSLAKFLYLEVVQGSSMLNSAYVIEDVDVLFVDEARRIAQTCDAQNINKSYLYPAPKSYAPPKLVQIAPSDIGVDFEDTTSSDDQMCNLPEVVLPVFARNETYKSFLSGYCGFSNQQLLDWLEGEEFFSYDLMQSVQPITKEFEAKHIHKGRVWDVALIFDKKEDNYCLCITFSNGAVIKKFFSEEKSSQKLVYIARILNPMLYWVQCCLIAWYVKIHDENDVLPCEALKITDSCDLGNTDSSISIKSKRKSQNRQLFLPLFQSSHDCSADAELSGSCSYIRSRSQSSHSSQFPSTPLFPIEECLEGCDDLTTVDDPVQFFISEDEDDF